MSQNQKLSNFQKNIKKSDILTQTTKLSTISKIIYLGDFKVTFGIIKRKKYFKIQIAYLKGVQKEDFTGYLQMVHKVSCWFTDVLFIFKAGGAV